MLFNSTTFLVFFIIVLFLHTAPLSRTFKKFNLLVASYIFYAAWNPPFVILLWVSTVMDWFLADRISKTENQRSRKALLVLSLVVNLGLLVFFKYGNFLVENFVLCMRWFHIEFQPLPFHIILPIGISFYTFQTLSYIIDVYLRRAGTSKTFLDYALYVTFFPHLVAGPIVRARYFLPQCESFQLASWRQFQTGIALMVLGLFEKVVIADFLMAPIADRIFAFQGVLGSGEAWLGTLAFSVQIFCDFAGYSTCAIGAALCLGFYFPRNFLFPYAAVGFTDFWRRWHISLSTWIRDYLYIPLGGNQQGWWKTLRNLFAAMFLGGLWHGAAWTFVIWGFLHGSYLVLERFLHKAFSALALWKHGIVQVFLMLLTYAAVCYGWMIFRAENWHQIQRMSSSMFALTAVNSPRLLTVWQTEIVMAATLGILLLHWSLRKTTLENVTARVPRYLTAVCVVVMAFFVCIVPQDGRAFIYFQF